MKVDVDGLLRRVYSGILVVIWIAAPYCLLQQVAIREVIWVQPGAIDRMIPVNFWALWVYFSYFALLGWVGLALERRLYLRFLVTVGWVTLVSHMVFLFVPSGVDRGMIDADGAPTLYRWMVAVDQPRHAFPSLHASLSVVAGLGIWASRRYGMLVKGLVWMWVFCIFWSAIALRQHYLVDLLSGGGLAGVVWWIVGRNSFDADGIVGIEGDL